MSSEADFEMAARFVGERTDRRAYRRLIATEAGSGMQKLIYGVFKVKRAWKLYSETGGSLSFDSRRSALSAGENAVRAALARGSEVELYLQDEQGNFESVAVQSLGH